MKIIITLFLITVFPALASPAFYMSVEEVLGLSECIFLVEIGMILDIGMSYMNQTQYTFHVLEVIVGADSLNDTYLTSYVANMGWLYTNQNGEEMLQPLLLRGSGYETTVEEGDTVIVFSNSQVDDSHQLNLFRIEPADSLESLQELLSLEK